MSKILLNLGAGLVPAARPKHGGGSWTVVNHDREKHERYIDVAWDLNYLPWPWGNDSVTIIQAHSVLEHLDIDLLTSINECWRILKAGGLLDIKLPLWNKGESYDDPTHRHLVGRHILDLFDRQTERGRRYGALYRATTWRIIEQTVMPRGTSLYGKLEALKP